MDKVQHFEIPVDDVKRAQKFYKDIFDWHIISVPMMGYSMIHTGPTNDENGMVKELGYINGGMMERKLGIQNPVITIVVDSIDKAVKKISAQGGEIVKEKLEVGDMGWAAYFKDSEGNTMGLFENKPGRE
jgi:uncharacterized protein